ncbi:RNA polymerase sigma factor [Pseudomarimonas salicorniae]|uniref:RNA polymerase sigma factor n=1 Tax=Pseudomarimonas salicorniae TaxID=2933270 RepID=A0ABT0GG96_9GAMM|nr:RNA polymerase sigma factor [Lysobacter sp. CAU 1642]MCK7593556.1 RNA polymerase sigma factor [Lysobacter sp. CAU 1642]
MNCETDPLVASARRGDAGAFRALVDRHGRAVHSLCWRITRDETLAEDAAQEAFLKAWRALGEFDGRAAFGTWLHRIAANAALEQLRRTARHRDGRVVRETSNEDEDADFLDGDVAPALSPGDHLAAAALQTRVARELDGMSALERSAFVLRHVEGASLEDIGVALSLNTGQSKQAIFRAVRKLRAALADWRQ